MKRFAPSCVIATLTIAAGMAWTAGGTALAEEPRPAPKQERATEKAAPAKAEAANEIVRAARAPAPAGPEVVVITNEVLARRYNQAPLVEGESFSNADLRPLDQSAAPPAEPAPAAPAAAAPPLEDPLVWMQKREEAAKQRAEAIGKAEADLAAAKQRVADLETQALAVVNPYAARPKLTPEEMHKRQTSGETAGERYQRTQEMLKKAREEVAAAEEKLAEAYRQ